MSNTPASKPAWQSPAVLIGGAIVIILLIVGLLFASGAFKGKEEPTPTPLPPTEEPAQPPAVTPTISITDPADGAVLDISNPIQVMGEGDGLFENNVVVQARDANGQVLAEEVTLLKMTREAGATGGTWTVTLDVKDVMPGTKGTIVAFSPDPKTGGNMAEASINVTFGTPVEAMISIQQPTNGAVLDITQPVQVSGEGQGLPEGNVAVQAVDANGNVLAQDATVLQGKDVGSGGKGSWSVSLDLSSVKPATQGQILAFGSDPKTGARLGQTAISVTFGEAVAAPTAIIDLPSQQIVVGQPAQFKGDRSTAADGHQIQAYAWDFGNGLSSSQPNPEVTYSNAGQYNVTLTVTDDLGQTGQSSVTITVADAVTPVPSPTPAPPEFLGDWELMQWAQGRQTPKPLIAGSKITLTINPDDTYEGFGGCDKYEGDYAYAKPGEINFLTPKPVPGASACTPEVQQQQTQYYTLLTEVTKYTVSGTQMQLSTSSGWTLFFESTP
jgi:heat shock protein HslJ